MSENVEMRAGDVLVVRQAGKISVLGEVRAPATLEISEPVTVLEALARAGSVTEDADLAHGQLITPEGSIPLDLEALLTRGEMRFNVMVNPGDVVVVPRAAPETVLILGAVERPGVINIREEEQRDLLRLLTVAQPTDLADLSRTYVYREDGRIVADMRAVMDAGDMAHNISLQPDDIVVVPELNTIYVLGATTVTGPVPLLPDLKLFDVVSRFANQQNGDLSQVTVVRIGPDGATEFIERDFAHIHDREIPEDLVLQEGDVVFIPWQERAGFNWGDFRNALWTIGAIVGLLGL